MRSFLGGKLRNLKLKKEWAYAYMPVLYFVLAVVLIGVVSHPYWSIIRGSISVLSSEIELDITTLTSIFDPSAAEEIGDVVDNSIVQIPNYNTEYAHLSCDEIGIDCPLYFGDSNSALAHGAGQYHGSWLPGYCGTILVAGHNTSTFLNLQYAEIGNVFKLVTNYGIFEYEVTDIQIYDHNDKNAFDLNSRDREVLVLYTCWPFQRMSSVKTDRLFVYCDKISGPTVINAEE